ncbi:MAG: SDR family oxidoreductase [Verrucomicrobiota bacterium]
MNQAIIGKTILITGANRGIGRTFVNVFLQHGAAKVYAAVRSLESAASLVQEHGEQVAVLRLDLKDPTSIQEAARQAADVDIVINNGGILHSATPVDEDAIDAIQEELDVNLLGLLRMAQAFAPVLKENGGGHFAQLNSVVSMKAFSNFATYSASKAAAYSITQSLRDVLAGQGTQVISVHPGPILTDMGDAAGLTEIAEPPELVAEALIEAIASGTFHVFPDSMARQIGGAYQSFAENVVEADMSEG